MIGIENYYAISRDAKLAEQYDDIWVVMRFAPRDIPPSFRSVPELAPSRELFGWFQRNKECVQRQPELFREEFAPRYISEIANSEESRRAMMALLDTARDGRRVALVCTCYHEELCHRSILAGILQAMSPDIEVKAAQDYRQYWHMMANM